FTEEKLGQAEKTELDAHLENLLSKAECTKLWTEKIMKQTEVLLQPNPSKEPFKFLFATFELMDLPILIFSQVEFFTHIPNQWSTKSTFSVSSVLAHQTYRQKLFVSSTGRQAFAFEYVYRFSRTNRTCFQKERKLLQNKRLDLDAAKTRLKKAKVAEARAASEQEVRITQSEFDRQAEITRLLLEGISSTHAHHLRCLNDFVEAQMTYYAQCYQYMLDLQKQLGSFPSTFLSNNNQSSSTPMQSVSTPSVLASASASLPSVSNSIVTSGISELKSSSGSRKARVLYDYDAANSSELSLLADEVITVYSIPGMDSDWLMGERGNQKGKVPITYLELLN
ncbi:SHLB1 protein, partial [Chroicocephalus maculipennis]|nr:SHLB1 protein [Chroicocephalus maculipennis]